MQASPSVQELSGQLAEALARIRKLEHDCAEYAKLVALLQEANERLQRGLTRHKAERFAPGDSQMSLAILQLALQAGATEASPATSPDAETQTVAEHERRKPVRKPLPEHLPRVPIEILPEQVKREGLDAFERIGADTREVIERRPASAVVVQLIYPTFVRKDRARNEATEVLVGRRSKCPSSAA